MADVESNVADESFAQSETQDEQPSHSTVSATVGIRRQANGTIGSVYSGNKIRHLKKEDDSSVHSLVRWQEGLGFCGYLH